MIDETLPTAAESGFASACALALKHAGGDEDQAWAHLATSMPDFSAQCARWGLTRESFSHFAAIRRAKGTLLR